MSKLKKIPKFKSEDDETDFWSKNDAIEYFDLSKGKHIRFSNLSPSTKTISLRLPEDLLDEIKLIAKQKDALY